LKTSAKNCSKEKPMAGVFTISSCQ